MTRLHISKENRNNLIWIVLILVLVFTPIGFHAKVYLNRLLSFSPSVITEDPQHIADYDWKLYDLNGRIFNFRQYEGKVVLVNFWATWCAPCIAEMPSLVSLYEAYSDQVQFVFLASDDSDNVTTYLAKTQYELPVFFSASQRPQEFSSNKLPTTYLIDRNGQIVVNKTGAADWDSAKVTALLDKLLAGQ